jgi:hypothetical protein
MSSYISIYTFRGPSCVINLLYFYLIGSKEKRNSRRNENYPTYLTRNCRSIQVGMYILSEVYTLCVYSI